MSGQGRGGAHQGLLWEGGGRWARHGSRRVSQIQVHDPPSSWERTREPAPGHTLHGHSRGRRSRLPESSDSRLSRDNEIRQQPRFLLSHRTEQGRDLPGSERVPGRPSCLWPSLIQLSDHVLLVQNGPAGQSPPLECLPLIMLLPKACGQQSRDRSCCQLQFCIT